MSPQARPSSRRDETYLRETLKPLYGLIFVFPMVLIFHLFTRNMRVNILVLSYFRGTASILPPLAIVTILMLQHLCKRDRWDLRWRVFGGMAVESVIWMLPLMAASHITAMLFLTATQPDACSRVDSILIGMGGGVYEEFVFHLIGIGLIMVIFVDGLSIPRIPVAIAAIAITAVLFAFSHTNIPPFQGTDAFSAKDFAFRTAAGLCLGTLFLLRGFGIAVGAHVMWNIYVFVV
jgi:hypothetical protein